MVGVVFFFEENDVDVYSGRRIHLDAWNYAIKAAGDITDMIVINRTDKNISSPDSELNFKVVSEMPDLDGVIVHLVCPWDKIENNSVALWDFDHEADWYVFGPASGWNAEDIIKVGVHIPQSNMGALHAVHVASIVMMHRYKVISWQHQ
jgi:hypothetical protein